MSPFAIIPHDEHAKLMTLTDEQRKEVLFWCRIVQEVDSAKGKSKTFAEIARRYEGVRGVSGTNIKNKYYAWKQGGWQTLINGSRLKSDQKIRVLGDAPTGQSPQFVEYWLALQERFQRSSKAAYRELIRIYRSGEQIPGIGTWRTVWMDTVGGLPPKKSPLDAPLPYGWGGNGRNLMRYKPEKHELAFMRGGLAEARKYLPKVYTTRVGMAPGQIYVFDDMFHDNLVNAPGNRKAMRPLEFACQDVFSAARVAWGIQPIRENPDTGKREMLRETEMRFLLCHVLCTLGYHPSGCRLHVEHGTAAIRKDLEEFLFEATDGAITVARGGIHNTPAFDGAFAPQARGNSRFKSTLESQHSLVHNELAHLPAQVGKDRDHAPEQIHGLQVYNTKLLAVAAELPPERAEMLEMPVLSIDQFRSVVSEAYNRINGRTDHRLEGWEEAGLIANEYRLSLASAWEPMTKLLGMDSDERALAEAMIQKRPDQFAQSRKLSPSEVFSAGSNNLVKLPYAYAPEILGRRNAKEIRLDSDHFLSFEDRRIGPDVHRYEGRVVAETGEWVHLHSETSYLIYATPFDPSAVFVCDMDNRFMGLAHALNVPCKTNTKGIHRQIGKARHEEALLLRGTKVRQVQKSKEMLRMHQHNAAVLRGDPLSPEEIFRTERITQSAPNAADLEAVTAHARPEEVDEFSNEEISELFS